jgi:hypothetical protein
VTPAEPDQRCGQFKKKRPGRQKIQFLHVSTEPPHTRVRLTKRVRQEGKMLTLTVLKSVMLVAGLVAASMFLQAAMSYGKLTLVLGQ